MELIGLTTRQMVIMLQYMLTGIVLYRLNVLTPAGSRDLASVLIKLVIPAVLVKSFCITFSVRSCKTLGAGTLLATLLLLLSIVVARVIFCRDPLAHFGAAFSNAAFMGIPLVTAVLGENAVLCVVPFVAILNLLQWTYGVSVICKNSTRPRLRDLLCNPPMVGIALGLLIFFSGAGDALPEVLQTTLNGICALNTPLAMIVLGIYLAQAKDIRQFAAPSLYGVCVVRLLLIPILSILAGRLSPFDSEVSRAVCICAAAPVGINVAMYAQLYGKDHGYAGRMVALSSLFSLVTLPLMTVFHDVLL